MAWCSRTANLLVAALALSACQSTPAFEPDRVEAEVRAFSDSVRADLAALGPDAWMKHMLRNERFFMASDGAMVFPNHDSAAAQVGRLAKVYTTVKLDWLDLRIEPLSNELALMASPYWESLVDTGGASVEFGGLVSAVAVRTRQGWKFQNLHWSSPQN